MNAEEIQRLLDEASGLYNDGNYDAAVGVWNRILEVDPENDRALEGVKMAQLLTTEWETTAPPPEPVAEPEQPSASPPMDPALTARIREALGRVQELIAGGDLEGAREGVEALQQVAPDAPEVLACVARVEAGANPAHYVEEQMALSRHFMILGDTAEAYRACRKVLEMDPDNAAAREILGAAAGAAPAPAAISLSEDVGHLELTNDAVVPAGGESGPLDLSLESPPVTPHTEDEIAPLELTETAAMGGGGMDLAGTAPSGEGVPLDLDLEEVAEEALPAQGVASPEAQLASAEAQIAALLAEGDQHRDEGNLDAAISSWSRIFVIEETHPEAEQRIDAARGALEEQGREIESALYRGEDLLGEGRLPDAREAFQAVLAIRPGHAEAQARLQEIERKLSGEEPEPEPVSAPAPAPPSPAPPAAVPPSLGESVPLAIPRPPPAPSPTPPSEASVPSVPVRTAPRGRGVGAKGIAGIAGLAIVVLVAAGYFGWKALFPPPPSGDLPASIETPPPSGGGAQPGEPAPPELQEGAGEAPTPAPAPVAVAPSQEPSPERSQELMQAGIQLFNSGEFSRAAQQFRQSMSADPMNFAAQDWLSRAGVEVESAQRFGSEIRTIRELFEERDYHNALYKLYRLETEDPGDRGMLEAWIGTCWYNWGVVLMRARNPAEAEEKLQEAVTTRPDDAEAAAHLDVAGRYKGRQLDSAYEAYISRLSLRSLE